MANSTGSAAKSNSRLCFTFVKVTTPTAPRAVLPTKFAVAEKHMARLLPGEDYTYRRATQNISHDAAIACGYWNADAKLVSYGRSASRDNPKSRTSAHIA